jgi:hypothetical protein
LLIKKSMKMKKLLTTVGMLLLISPKLWAQQAFQVTDQQPGMVNGLQMGYNIKSQETKTVGDKGDFSRYSVQFYVTNTTSEAKIMLFKNSYNSSDQLVQFNCLNATGARLTSKGATISAPACNITALVDDRDGSGKTVKNKRFVQIGYWIQAGQTLTANVILIVPLNEMPNVQAAYLGGQVQQMASASYGGGAPAGNYVPQNNQPPPPPPMLINSGGFLRLKNVSNGTYINIQTPTLSATDIKPGWWSAQWSLVPVPGTNFFTIKNRWQSTFIDVDRGYIVMSKDGSRQSGLWDFEPGREPNVFRIRNSQTGVFLCLSQTGQLIISHTGRDNMSTQWQLEQP